MNMSHASFLRRFDARPRPDVVWHLRRYGMVSPLGTSVDETLASWVGDVRVLQRVKVPDQAAPVTVARCAALPADQAGASRLMTMLASATAEALEHAVDPADSASNGDVQSLEILVVPSWLDESQAREAGDTWGRWLDGMPAWSQFKRDRLVLHGGSATPWLALKYAWDRLDAGQDLQHVLIAAVDSLCEPGQLERLARDDVLLREGHAEGFVAGEGAVCTWLQRVPDVQAMPPGAFALHRPCVGALPRAEPPVKPDELSPYESGAVLAETMRVAMHNARLQASQISHLLSDMDGSSWRARQESAALESSVVPYATSSLSHWQPAILTGNTGVAAAPMAWVLVARHHALGIGRVNTVLHWSVDAFDGSLAACAIERSPHID